MRSLALVVVSAIVGGLVGGMLIYTLIIDGGSRQGPPDPADGGTAGVPPAAGPAAGEDVAEPQILEGADTQAMVTAAAALEKAGRLREAQEAYLAVLLVDPEHRPAMQGLVRVVRALAGGNPDVLRRRVAGYRRAIASGTDTEEHYTVPAMELLIRAGSQALGDTKAPAKPASSRPSQARPVRPPARPAPTQVRPAAPTQARPAPPAAPSPARPSPAPQAEPPLDPTEPFLTVTVGPIPSGERASLIAAELTMAGFSARALRQEGGYVILLGPYRVSEANRAAEYVRSHFGKATPVALTPVPDVRTR